MKYVRTKDRIYVYDKAIQNIKFYWKTTLLSKYKINKYIKKDIEELDKSIIKRADTIKELCDGYYVDKDKESFIEKEVYEKGTEEVSQWLRSYFVSCVKEGIDVYAFIKTDKGLIYVAKMNEEGEWELL